jgi:hypothetical protein
MGIPSFSASWTWTVRGRLFRTSMPSSSIMNDPIRGVGTRAMVSMIRERLRNRFCRSSGSWRLSSHVLESIVPRSSSMYSITR